MASLKGPHPNESLATIIHEIDNKGLSLSSNLCSKKRSGRLWSFLSKLLASIHIHLESTHSKVVLTQLEIFLRKEKTQKDFFTGQFKDLNARNMTKLVDQVAGGDLAKHSKKFQVLYQKCLNHIPKEVADTPAKGATQKLRKTLQKIHTLNSKLNQLKKEPAVNAQEIRNIELELEKSKSLIDEKVIQEAHQYVKNNTNNRLEYLSTKLAQKKARKQQLIEQSRLFAASIKNKNFTLEETQLQIDKWTVEYGTNPRPKSISKDPEVVQLLCRIFATCLFTTTNENLVNLKFLLKIALIARASKNDKAKDAITRFIEMIEKIPDVSFKEELLEYGAQLAAEHDVDFFFTELQHFNINKSSPILNKNGLLFEIWETIFLNSSLKVALYLLDNKKVEYNTKQNESTTLVLQVAMTGEVKSELILSYALKESPHLAYKSGYHPRKPGINLSPAEAAIYANNHKLMGLLLDHYNIEASPGLHKLAVEEKRDEIAKLILEKNPNLAVSSGP